MTASHITTESCLGLKITELLQAIKSESGSVLEGSLHWHRDGELLSSIRYIFDKKNSHVTLCYRHVKSEKDLAIEILLERTLPHFGGVRWWFRCPRCDQRVGMLFLHGLGFACRCCHNLSYESQRLQRYKSDERKAQRMHRKLGGNGNLLLYERPMKPKWMRWPTYHTQIEKLEHLTLRTSEELSSRYRNCR